MTVAKRDLTKDEATTLVDQIHASLRTVVDSSREVAVMLTRAREQNAAGALGHPSWESFIAAEFGISRQHGWRLLEFARVAAELEAAIGLDATSPAGDITEREARRLAPDLGKHTRAVKRAAASLPADAPPERRAEVLRETLDRRKKDPRVTPPRPATPDTLSAPAGQPAAVEAPPPRWKDLLGDLLAHRVAKIAPDDPAGFCVRAVEDAARSAEQKAARKAKEAAAAGSCSHPEKDRGVNGRCRRCGDFVGVVFTGGRG